MVRVLDTIDSCAQPYLDGLNACFPGWGDARLFDWCFRRQVGGPAADLLVAGDDDAPIAGSAITYRRTVRSGTEELIACMTGSWTMPEARGRGLFRAMMQASLEQARRRGCRLLIAFAADGNGSVPALASASARIVEAAYLTSPEAGPAVPGGTTALPMEAAADACLAWRAASPASHFSYSPAEWHGQMVGRPDQEVLALSFAPGFAAVMARRPGVDWLIDMSAGGKPPTADAIERIAAASRAEGRRLFAYATDPGVIECLAGRGYTVKPGGVYLMPTDQTPVEGDWALVNGDRM
jgi:GNAT superfamily N-acetyltransferase